ncbi:hypothetical protein KXW38_008939, partial [Aspergillus fumigatus]
MPQLLELDRPVRAIGDIKTSRSGIFPETAWQVCAYRYADVYVDADGNEQPMPEFDFAFALHVRADDYGMRPLVAGPEQLREFLYVREVHRAVEETSKSYVGEELVPGRRLKRRRLEQGDPARMTEIEHYRGATPVPTAGTATLVQRDPAQDPLDGWIRVMADVAKLAEYIADTELVPDAIRRKPAAVAAIILSGREMNLPPMMSLRHLHIVKGKPGMSAELMRAQVLAAGHEIEYLETSDSRVTVKGRRRGESEWLTVSFTADQA